MDNEKGIVALDLGKGGEAILPRNEQVPGETYTEGQTCLLYTSEEKNASDAVVKKALEKEGKAILSNVRKGAAIVAMCIEGKQISSDELAQFLADRANSGAGDVVFVIGSSHGLSDEVKKAAALRFSMGRITMPHQLARLVLTEQIYQMCIRDRY